MGPCPHQAVTPVGLGRPCRPRAAHPLSGQQPPKLGPQVSMGHRPWGRRRWESQGGLQGGILALALLVCVYHLWTSDFIR